MNIREYFGDTDTMFDYIEASDNYENGSFSSVHILDNDYVLKVTDDEAYLSFLKVVEMCNDTKILKHLPIIYDRITIECVDYILMKRLYEFESENEWEAECAGYADKDSSIWWDICDSLNNTFNYLNSQSKSMNYKYLDDYRTSNLMETEEGIIVVTDPWCVP